MMEDGKRIFQELLEESQELKQKAWNYDHPTFSDWHEKAIKAVAQFAPVKVPAFSEVLFGSDFYFSKAIEDRFEINDRIALVDDLNLAEKIFNEIVELLEKESARKRFLALHENKIEKSNKNSSEGSTTGKFSELLKKTKEMRFSSREVEEIEGEIIRLELEFAQPRPNWDLIKRISKFFLDYDAELALFTLPIIFKEYEKTRVS